MKLDSRTITVSALIAAIYVILTIGLGNLAYGEIQFRASEVLVLLAFINPVYIIAVSVGTFIANLLGPFGLIDAIVGSIATATAMTMIWQTKRLVGDNIMSLFIASLWPVFINAFYVAGLIIFLDPGAGMALFVPIATTVGIGEFVVVSIVGILIYGTIEKNKHLMGLLNR